MSDHEVVYLEWIDSTTIVGAAWYDKEEAIEESSKRDGVLCKTLGFIIYEGEESISVTSHVTPEEVGSYLIIPKVCIIERLDFKVFEEAGSVREITKEEFQSSDSLEDLAHLRLENMRSLRNKYKLPQTDSLNWDDIERYESINYSPTAISEIIRQRADRGLYIPDAPVYNEDTQLDSHGL